MAIGVDRPGAQRAGRTTRREQQGGPHDEGLDLALLPIGDYYTMGVEDSIRAVKLLRPKFVVPIHYNTFPAIAQDVDAWADRIRKETHSKPVVLEPGDWFDIPK